MGYRRGSGCHWREMMISNWKPIPALATIVAAAGLCLGLGTVAPADAAPRHTATAHKSVARHVTTHRVRNVGTKRVTKSVRTHRTVKHVTPKTMHKSTVGRVGKTVKHTTIAKPTGLPKAGKIAHTGTGFKTMKFASGKTKVVHFAGQKGLKHKPSNFIRPAHIPHNPKHIAGLHGFHHHHNAFFFRHGGHRWHRWYYPLAVGGLWYWYWYDLPADNDPAVVSLSDSALPDCDPDDDECLELDE